MDELNEKLRSALRGLGLSVVAEPGNSSSIQPNLRVELPTADGGPRTVMQVQRHGFMSAVELEKWRSQNPPDTILGCDYVTPAQSQRLRAAGIDYVDTVGNAHISGPGLLIHVEGRRKERPTSPPPNPDRPE